MTPVELPMPITKKFAAILAALSLFLSFSPALAATRTSTAPNFCTKINDTASQLNSLLTKLSNNRGNLRQSMLQNLSDRKQQRAAQIQTIRDNARSQFVANLNDLDSKVTTDAQKAAVAAFKSSVNAALTTRNQAID